MSKATIESGSRHVAADFSGLDFAGQALTDCQFERCNFVGVNFRAANLSHSQFDRCEFNNATAQQPADFSQANLRDTVFTQCNLTLVDFVRCTGYALTFEHCQLQGADLSKADFRMPIGHTDLVALFMRHCNFSYGNLANNYLPGCELTDCRMIEACLDYCDLTNANLSGSQLHNINAVGITLIGANLKSCEFNNLNPAEIDLTGVQIYHQQLAHLLGPLGIIVEDDPN